MDINGLMALVTVLISLSVASERLVEIVKGVIPFLNEQSTDKKKEGWRRSALQAMAVAAGIITALLAGPAIEAVAPGPWNSFPGLTALGLLASGGSGFWNSILTYMTGVKNIKKGKANKLA